MKQFVTILTFDRGFGGSWSKGATLQEALDKLRNQHKRSHGGYPIKPLEQKYPTMVYQAVLKEDTTDEQIAKLQTFWNVGDIGGMFKAIDLSPEEEALIKDKFVGWLTNEYIPVKLQKKVKN